MKAILLTVALFWIPNPPADGCGFTITGKTADRRFTCNAGPTVDGLPLLQCYNIDVGCPYFEPDVPPSIRYGRKRYRS